MVLDLGPLVIKKKLDKVTHDRFMALALARSDPAVVQAEHERIEGSYVAEADFRKAAALQSVSRIIARQRGAL